MIYEFDANGMTEGIGVPTFINDVFRWYVYFDGNGSIQIPTITLSGDFKIIFSMQAAMGVIFGHDADKNIKLESSSGYGRLLIGDGAMWDINTVTTTKIFDINQQYEIEIKRVGAAVTLSVNGVVEISKTSSVFNQNISYIGKNYISQGPQYLVGYVWDFNINNQRLYKLNKNVYPGLVFEDSIGGQHGQGYNFQESSFVTELS
jgi:hypothetical protein